MGRGAEVTWENGNDYTHPIRFNGEDETAKLEAGRVRLPAGSRRPARSAASTTLHPRDMEGEVRVGQSPYACSSRHVRHMPNTPAAMARTATTVSSRWSGTTA